jgi:uncharacterized protein (TIGR02099 family)
VKLLSWRVLRGCWQLSVLLLLLLTVYLTAGRLLMPQLSTQAAAIEAQLSQLASVPVTLSNIEGSWFRFSPSLVITDLHIGSPTLAGPQHRIGRVELALDVVASLLAQQPVIARVSVADMVLTLQEQADGRWGLAGLPVQRGNYTDTILDFLLTTNELTVKEASLLLQRRDGQQIQLNSLILGLQNRGVRHNAQLQVLVGTQVVPAQLVLQLRGDPRRTFQASAWMDSGQLDWLPLLGSVLPTQWQWQQVQGRGRLWLAADSNGLQDFSVELSEVNIDAQQVDSPHLIALHNGSVQFNARPVFGEPTLSPDWQLRVQQLVFEWQQTAWAVGNLQVGLRQAPTQVLSLQADSLDLAMLTQVVGAAVPMPPAAQTALQTLNAQGLLRNVQLETSLDGSYPQGFRLRSNLDNVAVAAWQQAPAASGLKGYVEATAQAGFAEVDTQDLSFQLPQLFDTAWHYDKVNTRVSWEANADEVKVRSSILEVANSELAGRLSFDIHNTRNADGLWFNELSLQIGMRHMQVSAAPAYLPRLPRLQTTMNWLRAALQGGELGESGFLLHSISGLAAAGDTAEVASWYRVQNGLLKFLPDWPPLTGLNAAVVQRNNDIDIIASSGTLAGIALDTATARIRPAAGGRQLLSVGTTATTTTAIGIDFLRTTPVHATVGNFIDNWQARGEIAVQVGVGLDLQQAVPVPYVKVVTDTDNSRLDLTDYDLQLSNIVGQIRYSSAAGLEAAGLRARLFDYPLLADISTQAAGTPMQTISVTGNSKASVPLLQQWSGQPVFVRELLNYMQGEVAYRATLTVAPGSTSESKQTRLLIESDLVGLSSGLPLPLAKATDQSAPLALELGFDNAQETLDIRYRDWLTGSLLLDEAGIERGQLSVGERNRTFNVRQTDTNAAGVLVSGDLESFDVMAWDDIARDLNRAGGEGRAVADYLRLIDVNVGELILPGLTLNQANVVVTHAATTWQISAHNDFLAGTLLLPDDNLTPWQFALDYLRFPPWPVLDPTVEALPESVDPLADVDPTQLPAFDFKTAELSFGEQNLGAVSLEFRPDARGASITNFHLESPDSKITDSAGTGGATLDWQYSAGINRSSFSGLFAAGNLAKVLPAWGHAANVVSEVARFDSSLQWPGSPLYFAVKRASGTVNMDIDNGRFIDIDSGSTRLFGALNFDALVRRLQLDFSDIFAKGYSFDSIDGLLTLNDGVVTTVSTPLTIDGPASDLSIRGEINLRDETIAADMEVQIPLGENLSMVAGLLGAWPIAVSTYLASKIFANQVDEFTTVIYRLEGPWDQPTAGFEPPDAATATTPDAATSSAATPATPPVARPVTPAATAQ